MSLTGSFADSYRPAAFGLRRAVPRVCVIDNKPHIRTFLAEALEELGFVAQQCARKSEVAGMLARVTPDLIVLGQLNPQGDVTATIRALASEHFPGKVMLFGGRSSLVLLALHDLGENLGLAMLPPLLTPFRDSDLQENLADFLPIPPSPCLPIDVGETLGKGWLELWYQPKVDLRSLALRGVEALVRMRHPVWGVVAPAAFLPSANDPQFRALSDFVIRQAMADWKLFDAGRLPIEMSINLPLAALETAGFVEHMCLQLPDLAVSSGFIVEINGTEIDRKFDVVREIAAQFKAYKVDIAIDDLVSEELWENLSDVPFAEIKVARKYIDGCATDPQKRTVCGTVVELTRRFGIRAVAEGLENAADFRAVRDMGFELGQGYLFGKPMEPRKFARTVLRRGGDTRK